MKIGQRSVCKAALEILYGDQCTLLYIQTFTQQNLQHLLPQRRWGLWWSREQIG